jgi:hypothetical protein
MNADPWYAGTLTLGAAIVGALVGAVIAEIPLAVAAATGVGAGLEIWLNSRAES